MVGGGWFMVDGWGSVACRGELGLVVRGWGVVEVCLGITVCEGDAWFILR